MYIYHMYHANYEIDFIIYVGQGKWKKAKISSILKTYKNIKAYHHKELILDELLIFLTIGSIYKL